MSDFFAMGGYAFYVWTSYGIAFLVMLAGVVRPLIAHRYQLRDMQLRRLRGQK
jgi:heme exporter protein D